ncbi:hypothetical protein MJO47_09390 [Desulfuromonas sp. KJ2020]|uniref:hypothetical protein n=1 Tax=Desulfuromonas sp. KJ2020 TaxID=2919173 RepID=UPI0020A7970C|nr:hypothetical protein [Desulfuromonas sp. KJ2020]MCP3177311.1 hypothetical protein [Desulfuromonas sp. KJ2020]
MSQPAFLYCSYLPSAVVTAPGWSAASSVADVLLATEDTFLRPADQAGDKAITIDFGEDRTCDCLGIVGNALDGCLVDVEASADGFVSDIVPLASGVTLEATANAAAVSFAAAVKPSIRLTFKSGFYPSNLRVAWLCASKLALLPYMDDGSWNPEDLDVEGEFLISQRGLFLGSEVERAMISLNLAFGQVSDFEFTLFEAWKNACVATMSPFFFVPDVDEPKVFFGWPPKKFVAPIKHGMYDVGTITMTTRGA